MLAPSKRLAAGWLGLASLLASTALADVIAWTVPDDDLPDWASKNTLQLRLSTGSTNYAVIPLTEKLASGQTTKGSSSTISIKGNLKAADHTNFDEITSSNDIAYLSCDKSETSSYITPDKMLNDLMSQAPKAIVLYSTAQNWCSISYKGDLEYTTILSMTDTGEAESVLEHLNETSSHGKAGAFIYGSATKKTSIDSDGQSNSDGKSAVAMSVLYSITGLVTFLFLVIIVNGAIRAHRHPERYGPRRAAGGRPRQSRAKGLARAVLETLPVVKFGDQNPSKPDPELELADDAATTDGRRSPTAAGARDLVATEGVANAGSGSGSGSGPGAVASGSGDATASGSRSATPRASMASDPDSTAAAAAGAAAPRASTTSQSPPENPGCSICTEDFKVGEDMRVLPCHHQFHPECVDPWLVNVSGTCPLCRLDLRPGHASSSGSNAQEANADAAANGDSLPPPLNVGGRDGTDDALPENTAVDVDQLRQAPAHQRMEMLRRMRGPNTSTATAEAGEAGEATADDHHRGARLALRLKDKFRVLTRQARHEQ